MQDTAQISEFGKILVFLALGVFFILAGYGVNSLLSKKKPNPIKNATYECGEESVGNSWVQFNMRFYVIALLFLIRNCFPISLGNRLCTTIIFSEHSKLGFVKFN